MNCLRQIIICRKNRTEPLNLLGFAKIQLRQSVINGSDISIAHLFKFVKGKLIIVRITEAALRVSPVTH